MDMVTIDNTNKVIPLFNTNSNDKEEQVDLPYTYPEGEEWCWECPCGNHTFYINGDYTVQCTECDYLSTQIRAFNVDEL